MPSVHSIILEIRAGAGGEEASLFAKDLCRMYSRYADAQGWQKEILDENFSEIGGLKQIVLKITGENVLQKLKNEAGVHRVQRIPATEKAGRIHTSTASVAVLTIPSETEIKINPSEIKMDFYKSSGKGGQNVNKRQTAIRITHLPTGIVVTSQTQRNLEQNRQNALNILRAKLFEKEQIARQNELSEERRNQIGMAQRAEKIRTYNFLQDRVTDHRIKKSFHNIEKIMDGDLEKIIQALEAIK